MSAPRWGPGAYRKAGDTTARVAARTELWYRREDAMLITWSLSCRTGCIFAAALGALAAGWRSAGPYGHSKIYSASSAEEQALKGSPEYDALLAERAPAKLKDRSVWLFGVVTNRGSGPGGAAYVALSLRS